MILQSTGSNLLAVILRDGRLNSFLKLTEDQFSGHETEIFKFIRSYYDKYGHLPSIDLACNKTSLQKINDKDLFGYYKDEFNNRLLYNKLSEVLPLVQNLTANKKTNEAVLKLEDFLIDAKRINHNDSEELVNLSDLGTNVLEFISEARVKGGLTGVPSGWSSLDEATNGFQKGDLYIFAARVKVGKALYNEEPVLTKNGWVKIKNINKGDTVFSEKGEPIKVTGVYPQGYRTCYKVELSNKDFIYADEEHLWQIKTRSDTKTFNKTWTTKKIKEWMSKFKQKHLFIPLNDKIKFEERKVSITPYLMGLLLGDGSFRGDNVYLTKRNKEDREDIINNIPVEFKDRKTNHRECISFSKLTKYIKKYGLLNKYSYEKFIPEDYLYNTIENRTELLRGLMDTDGGVELRSNGSCLTEFCTSSYELFKGVKFLVQSLGGKVRYSVKSEPKFVYKNETRVGRPSYILRIQTLFNPFKIKRKADKFKVGKKIKAQKNVTIKKITKIHQKLPCTCITVNNPTNLFIAKDFIVTHNSVLLMKLADYAHSQGFLPLWVSMEMSLLQLARRHYALKSGINMSNMKSGMLSSFAELKIQSVKKELSRQHPFYYVQGQFKKSIEDIASLTHGLRPDILYIDGGYLVKLLRLKVNSKWEYIAEVAQAMKDLATNANIPVVVTFQFNREYVKSKKKGVEHLQLSDALGQLASLVVGVREENPENHHDIILNPIRNLTALAGREGESFSFDINWDFNSMNFDEIIGEGSEN